MKRLARIFLAALTLAGIGLPQFVFAQTITPQVTVATNKAAYVVGDQVTVTTTAVDPNSSGVGITTGPQPIAGAYTLVNIKNSATQSILCSSSGSGLTTNSSGVSTYTCPVAFSTTATYYAEVVVSEPLSGTPTFSDVTQVSQDFNVTTSSVTWAFTPSNMPSFAINQAISFGATVTDQSGSPASGSIYIESITGPGNFSFTNTAGNNAVTLNSSGQATLSAQALSTAGSYSVGVCYKQTLTSGNICSNNAVTITINSSTPIGPTQPSTGTATTPAKSKGLIIECDRAVTNPDGTVNEEKTKRCGVEQFVNQFVVLGQYGITIVIFLAALMLVYGGFEFITAGGRQSKISSGQNIITGTVIGLLISFSAYVIINFAVGAITGTKTSTNPFTAISTVFNNPKNEDVKNLVKPFSGEGAVTSSTCREDWDSSCSNHILCVDPVGEDSGVITSAQARLNNVGCGCGKTDGCFGEQTLTCVRRFQVANGLVPSGTLDQATSDKLYEASPIRCDGVAKPEIDATLAALPKPTDNVSGTSTGTEGCCVIQKNVSGATTPLYCINNLDQRACAALGGVAKFVPGVQCAASGETNTLCGFCRTPDDFCIEEVGQYWCTAVAKNASTGGTLPITFEKGVCRGGGVCAQGCDDTLKTTF